MNRFQASTTLIAGVAGLDFLNAIAPAPHQRMAALANGEDLVQWMWESGLISTETLMAIRGSTPPQEIDEIAVEARALGAWFSEFVHGHKGRPIPASAISDLEPLNHILEGDLAFSTLAVAQTNGNDKPEALVWGRHRRWRSAGTILIPIAEAMADLVCNQDFTYVRECEGAGCNLLFLDQTRARTRRWCSMAGCGNRAKQALYRRVANENH